MRRISEKSDIILTTSLIRTPTDGQNLFVLSEIRNNSVRINEVPLYRVIGYADFRTYSFTNWPKSMGVVTRGGARGGRGTTAPSGRICRI